MIMFFSITRTKMLSMLYFTAAFSNAEASGMFFAIRPHVSLLQVALLCTSVDVKNRGTSLKK